MASRLISAVAAVLSLGVLVAIYRITADQGDSPAGWFVALLVVAMAGLGYGVTSGPRRGAVLMAASVLVSLLGLLAIFTVGLLLLAAGAAGFVASAMALSSAPRVAVP